MIVSFAPLRVSLILSRIEPLESDLESLLSVEVVSSLDVVVASLASSLAAVVASLEGASVVASVVSSSTPVVASAHPSSFFSVVDSEESDGVEVESSVVDSELFSSLDSVVESSFFSEESDGAKAPLAVLALTYPTLTISQSPSSITFTLKVTSALAPALISSTLKTTVSLSSALVKVPPLTYLVCVGIASLILTSLRSFLPVLLTVMVYSISSPTFTTLPLAGWQDFRIWYSAPSSVLTVLGVTSFSVCAEALSAVTLTTLGT